MTELQLGTPGQVAAEQFVADNLAHLVSDPIAGSPSIRGGQSSADAALAAFDVTGYAATRNEVWPAKRQGASRLSPYIRHGLLRLDRVWAAVDGGPSNDVRKFRDELLWQEFARHRYGRLGGSRHRPNQLDGEADEVWDRSMACLDLAVTDLEVDGWVVNQQRMWLASHWSVRQPFTWQSGEDAFFRHLLDGSRAANRLGWQWTAGVGSAKQYGFSRWQVNKRAAGLCATCEHNAACPIEEWPEDPPKGSRSRPVLLHGDVEPSEWSGPTRKVITGAAEAVWLTAESLGFDDPALSARPDLPAVFVFDEPLLARLQLSAKRFVFLVETLAELAVDRELTVLLGDPVELLAGRKLAATFAAVPGFRAISEQVEPVELHPWSWLCAPATGSVASFSAWRRSTTHRTNE